MIIKKKQSAIELEQLIALLETKTSVDLEVEFTYINKGFLLYHKATDRYARCAVLDDHEGINIEFGVLGKDAELVMSPLSNGETTLAAIQIFNWFSIESGLVMTTGKGFFPPLEVHRVGGVTKKYRTTEDK